MTFTLFTSIPPRSNYAPVIANWRDAGFRVISINNTEEAEQLRGSGIQTIAIQTNERKLPLSLILNAIRETEEPFAAIINSDCKFITSLSAERLRLLCLRSVIVAERIDVDENGFPAMYRAYGFDALFFDTSAIADLKLNSAFRIGAPWWDYWLPFAFESAKYTIKRFSCPILVHQIHESIWDQDQWRELALSFKSEHPNIATGSEFDISTSAYNALISRASVVQSDIPESVAKLLSGIPSLLASSAKNNWRQHPTLAPARWIRRKIRSLKSAACRNRKRKWR